MSEPDDASTPEPLKAEIKLIRDQVDQLQIAAAEKRKPWHKQRPSLMSLVALAFSIFTFALTQQKASLQEVRSKREELRKLLLELVACRETFTKELMPLPGDTADQRQSKDAGSSLLNSRRAIFLEAAEALADQLSGHVSSSEYNVLANEKLAQADFKKAGSYFLLATHVDADPISNAVASRAAGMFCFSPQGRNFDEGRKWFAKACASTENEQDDYSIYHTGMSYQCWGFSEVSWSFKEDGRSKLKKALECYERMSPGNPRGVNARAWLQAEMARIGL